MSWHKVTNVDKKGGVEFELSNGEKSDGNTNLDSIHNSLWKQKNINENEIWVWVDSKRFSNIVKGYSVGEKPQSPPIFGGD